MTLYLQITEVDIVFAQKIVFANYRRCDIVTLYLQITEDVTLYLQITVTLYLQITEVK